MPRGMGTKPDLTRSKVPWLLLEIATTQESGGQANLHANMHLHMAKLWQKATLAQSHAKRHGYSMQADG